MSNAKSKAPAKRKTGASYDPETAYQYFKTTGGNLSEAMRMAESDKRAPKNKDTWWALLKKNEWRARYQKETVEEWKLFHAEREAKKQHMLDRVAFAIEPLIMAYGDMLGKALAALRKKDNYELALLRKDFAIGPEIFDKMVRLYCRAMGMPERITHSSHEIRNTTILTYAEAEKQKAMSASGRITRPMVAKDLEEATKLMASIDLGPEWALPEDETMA